MKYKGIFLIVIVLTLGGMEKTSRKNSPGIARAVQLIIKDQYQEEYEELKHKCLEDINAIQKEMLNENIASARIKRVLSNLACIGASYLIDKNFCTDMPQWAKCGFWLSTALISSVIGSLISHPNEAKNAHITNLDKDEVMRIYMTRCQIFLADQNNNLLKDETKSSDTHRKSIAKQIITETLKKEAH